MFACCFVFNVYQYCSQAIPYLSKYPLVPSTNMDIIEGAIWVVYVKLIQFFFFFFFKTNKKQPFDSHEWAQQYHTQFDCDKPGFLHVHKPTHGRPRLKKPQGVRRLTLPTIGLGEWQVRKNLKLLRMTLGCGLKFQDDAKSVTSKATNVMQNLVKLGGVYKGTFCQIMKQVYIFMCAVNIWIY